MALRELLEHQTGLYAEQTSCVVEDRLGETPFQQCRRTFIDCENTPVTVQTVTLHRLDCGHIVGSRGSQELLGRCDRCGKWMCFRCGARCVRCFKLLCPSCMVLFESQAHCSRCRRIILLKRGFLGLLRRFHEGLSA